MSAMGGIDTSLVYVKFGNGGAETTLLWEGLSWPGLRAHCMAVFRPLLPENYTGDLLVFRRFESETQVVGDLLSSRDGVARGEVIYLDRPGQKRSQPDGGHSDDESERKRHMPLPDVDVEPTAFYEIVYETHEANGTFISAEDPALVAHTLFSPAFVSSALFQAWPRSAQAGEATTDTTREPPLQACNTRQAAAVLASIQGAGELSRFWVDTHVVGSGGVLTGNMLKPKWNYYPDGAMGRLAVKSPGFLHCLDVIGLVEYKASTDALTDRGYLGQVFTALWTLMTSQPSRAVAYSLLANYANVRLMCVRRTAVGLRFTMGPVQSSTDGPPVLFGGVALSNAYSATFNAFLLAGDATLGFIDPKTPAGWVRGPFLGEGSFGRVISFSGPGGVTAAVKTMEAAADATAEREFQVAVAALVDDDSALVAECLDAAALGFSGQCIVMRPVGAPLATLTALQARQVAVLLDRMHAGGMLHRDVRMPNILKTDADRAMLVDFGTSLRLEPGGATAPVIQRSSLTHESDRVLALVNNGADAIAYTVADERESFAKLLLDLRMVELKAALDDDRKINCTNRVRWARGLLWTWKPVVRDLEAVRAMGSCVAIVEALYR